MKDSTQLISGMDVISGTAPTRSQKITGLELQQAPSTRTGIVSQRVTLRAWMWKNSSKPRTPPKIGTISLTIGYMGVSKNGGTPKWMVYNGKPY